MRLRLCDIPSIETPSGSTRALAPRDAVLLAWLAIEGPTARERIGALLWPGSTAARAGSALRQRLFQLRRQIGSDVALGSPLLTLADGVEHDLLDAPGLLGELRLADAPELDAWLQRQRHGRQRGEWEQLQAQAEAMEAAGNPGGALRVAQALLRLQPLSEPAHQRVMRLFYLCGDRAAALAAFDNCEQMLKHELGTRPSPQTLALLATLEQAQLAPLLTSLPAAVLRPPRCVGRDEEFRRVQQAWARSATVLLEGEAGIGKSRLLADLAAWLAETQRHAVVVSARPGDEHVPYAVIGRLTRAWIDIGGPPLPAIGSAELGRVLPEFDEPAALEAGAGPARLLGALAGVIGQAQAAGLQAVCIDDLHFTDAASVELLGALVGDGRLHWALAYRSHELGPTARRLVQRWCDEPQTERVPLKPLPRTAVAELLASLQLGGLEPATAAAALHRHTGGNPMYLLETLKAQLGDGGAPDWNRLPVAENVRQLIQRRLDRLSAAALRLVRLAAVAGADFAADLAVAVLQTPALDLVDAWNELEQAQVLHDGHFAHDLIFEAARASVPQPLARQLHAEIARWLAQADAPASRLADHAFAGGEWAIAAPAYQRAAQRARRDGLAATAQHFFQRAAAAQARLGDAQGRFEALRSAVESSTHRALDRETEQALDELAALAEGEAQQLAVDVLRLELHGRLGRTAEAVDTGLRALAAARRIGHFEWGIQAATVTALALGAEPEPALARPLLEAVEWITTKTPAGLELEKFFCLGAIHDITGSAAEAVQCYAQAAGVALAQGRNESASTVLINAANVQSRVGNAEQALALGRQSLAVIAAAGERQRRVDLQHKALQIATFERDAGHLGEAVAGFERLLPWFIEQGDDWRAFLCSQRLALCFGQLGQFARAQQLMAGADAALPEDRRLVRTLGRIEVAHLADAGLAAFAEAASATLQQALPPELRHQCSLTIGLVLEPTLGRPWLQEAERYYARRGMPGQQALALARLARMSRLAGDVEQAAAAALRLLGLAADHAPRAAWRAELWLEAALALRGAGDAAAAQRAVAAGLAWLQAVLPQVPVEFRPSFLQRNAVSRQLQALAPAGLQTAAAAG